MLQLFQMNLRGRISTIIVAVLGVFILSTPVLAADEEIKYGGGNVKPYASDTNLQVGTIVELVEGNKVKAVTQSTAKNMFGMVVDRNDLSVTITNDDGANDVYVAVSGTYKVLVSDQAGEIKKGDYVSISSVAGVGMKAGVDRTQVFGRAAADFNGKGSAIGQASLVDVDGNEAKVVNLGSIPVTIDIRNNPNDISTDVDIIEQLRRIGQAIAEKEVDPIRIYLSMAITAVSLITAIVVLAVGVRNSIVSIGRNPNAKKSILRGLLEIILASLLILIVGLFAVYLLLKL